MNILATALAAIIINVAAPQGSQPANEAFTQAIEQARTVGGATPVVIQLDSAATYHLTRPLATPRLIYVSNTTSETENPDPTKHVGILMENLRNVTIDGRGSTLLSHGELTLWAMQGCSNITLRNLTIDAADPSVTEMTVIARTDSTLITRTHRDTHYRIDSLSRLHFVGEGWDFTGGIAQIYDPMASTTLRTSSPVVDATSVRELAPGFLQFSFAPRLTPDDAMPGRVYQMRHSIRNELPGIINLSDSITLENIRFRFTGNFGIVTQTSSDITCRNLTFAPDPASGRTNVGFADFLHFSSVAGHLDIRNCSFSGSQDDPINVHGTFLRVDSIISPTCLRLRFMHPQTFGFPIFFSGNDVGFVNALSLLTLERNQITGSRLISPRIVEVNLAAPVSSATLASPDLVLENLSLYPSVTIADCDFTLTPTRGILVTTPRPVQILDNTFRRCHMSAILIADDACSWYESGAVRDVTIAGNTFIDCVNPVIQILPERKRYEGPVHSGVTITRNHFINTDGSPALIHARDVEHFRIGLNDGPLQLDTENAFTGSDIRSHHNRK